MPSPTLTSYLKLLIYSYLSTSEQLHQVALLSSTTRNQLVSQTTRLFTERTLTLTLTERACATIPRYLLSFADRVSIQAVASFRGRPAALEALFQSIPSRLSN
jgi:hypothetical protein